MTSSTFGSSKRVLPFTTWEDTPELSSSDCARSAKKKESPSSLDKTSGVTKMGRHGAKPSTGDYLPQGYVRPTERQDKPLEKIDLMSPAKGTQDEGFPSVETKSVAETYDATTSVETQQQGLYQKQERPILHSNVI